MSVETETMPLSHCRRSVSDFPMISRCSILTGTFLLIVHCISAGLEADQEPGANASSVDLSLRQETRELGRPLYRVFTKRDQGIVDKVITSVQDSRGLMIFGSVNCLLEYDGQRWTSIPIPNGGMVGSLARDGSGTGGQWVDEGRMPGLDW